ncbi:acyl-CoA dehydrogenase family protein [Streptomyces zaomyceticus]|uniref:acyl-CoA dehydrogenase family protein n=1 Tax=Streptomyces zaomyceticus TaxID=68286 RepID=UPI002E121156|nr:acyl-CoA dehydrogenase family protein [Streptomyces zaomyceticus]
MSHVSATESATATATDAPRATTSVAESVAVFGTLLDGSDPASGPFGAAANAELDRREDFPAEACAALDALGLPAHYVDVRHGGRLRDMPELVGLQRAVARRDLTVAVAHGKTFLGAAPVWLAGRPDQAARLAGSVRRGAVVSWALTERDHGGDLLAGGLTARPVPGGGWRLDGEKWLINNAGRSRYVCLLARTRESGGPRGFSVFLVDKTRLAPGSYRVLPKVRTHGIRGADISGIAFDGAMIDDDALVGEAGTGLDTVLRTLQLTRVLCTALSLGALDHALDVAVPYARGRNLYGRDLATLPRVRRTLGEAAAALDVAETVVDVAARAIHTLTPELALVSAVTKALVPNLVQDTLDRITELLGVRGFLSDGYLDGSFAKLERDHRIVAVFDGSTAVTRNLTADHFPSLARAWRGGRAHRAALPATVTGPLPPFAPERLRLLSAGSTVVELLPEAAGEVRRAARHGMLPRETARMAAELEAVTRAVHRTMDSLDRTPRDVPQAAFDLAERYELCFAGAAVLHRWTAGPRTADAGLRLRAGLALVLGRLGLPIDERRAEAHDRLADGLLGPAHHSLTLPSPRQQEGAR